MFCAQIGVNIQLQGSVNRMCPSDMEGCYLGWRRAECLGHITLDTRPADLKILPVVYIYFAIVGISITCPACDTCVVVIGRFESRHGLYGVTIRPLTWLCDPGP
jgi:hypothetical protein